MASTLLLIAAAVLQAAPTLSVTVDSARSTVTFAYRVDSTESVPAVGGHAGHHASSYGHGHIERMERAAWPVSGWIRGAQVVILGPDGARLPHRLLHHANLLNFDRAQLVHPGVERLWASGPETEPIVLPASVGVPVDAGMRVGLVVAFVPGDLPAGTSVEVIFRWTPQRYAPRPIDVLPVAISVGYRTNGSSAYDIAPGLTEATHEFIAAISGRVIGAGGHLHDHAVEVRLEEIESGRTIRIRAIRDDRGRLLRVERKLPGVSGRGWRVTAGTRYRLVAVYDNPMSDTLQAAAMGSIALGFAPDRLAEWPALDTNDAEVRNDLAHLATFERR